MNWEAIRYFRSPAVSPKLRALASSRSFDPAEAQHGESDMIKRTISGPAIRRSLVAAGLVAGATFTILGPVSAGECPADKRGLDLTKADMTPAKGVTDTVLAAIDLSKERAKIQDRELRLRKLVIQPGGVVPWHSHGDRPAIIYIIEGEITEFASTCAVPIVHKAGDVTREIHSTSHWWKNTGDKTVVLLSADVLHDKADKNM
jgi:quercetin dioxygenase-like cupin family protein